MTWRLYLIDVMVMSVKGKEKSFVSAVDDLVRVLCQVASSDGYRGSWQLSIPNFVNRSAAPSSVPPMSTYLLSKDCISFIKRFYEQCDTKEQLFHNDYHLP